MDSLELIKKIYDGVEAGKPWAMNIALDVFNVVTLHCPSYYGIECGKNCDMYGEHRKCSLCWDESIKEASQERNWATIAKELKNEKS